MIFSNKDFHWKDKANIRIAEDMLLNKGYVKDFCWRNYFRNV